MKLLLDQNLSRNLVGKLIARFPGSAHVTSIGLDQAPDADVWAYAGEHDYVIVSKDSDFRQLAFLHGPPPKAVWLRIGNASTTAVLQLIVDHADRIDEFGASDDEALLVIPTLRAV